MKDVQCFVCKKYVSPFFIREVLVGIWPFRKKRKVCVPCVASRAEGVTNF